MYIEKYWDEYIGGTDDSLTLTAYLAEKGKDEITLEEIFSDFGRGTLFGDFRRTDPPLAYTNSEGWEMGIQCAIDLIADLAALCLECREGGSVDLLELDDTLDLDKEAAGIRVTATPEEDRQMERILAAFVESPLDFDVGDMVSEEDVTAMAAVCEELRRELYG